MVRGSLPASLFLLSLLCTRLPAGAAQASQRGPSSEAVNAAIERGIDFLLRSQNRDGSFGVDLNERGLVWHDLRDGATALTVYTLLKCGFAPDHPVLQRAVAFLLESEPRHTYATGVLLHAFGALGDGQHERMRALVATLVELRRSDGWDYPGMNRGDLSNTQVAALGLRAAHAAGLDLPRSIWGELAQATLRYQEKPVEVPGAGALAKEKRRMAGFGYEPGWAASASMTTAGLSILGILGEDPGRVDHRFEAEIAEARQLALNWLEQHYSVAGNPAGEAGWHFYYLYGLERVGALFGLTRIAGHDWYTEGAAQLLLEQRDDGGWRTDGRASWPPAPMPIANSCFALLFLRKATLSAPAGRREHFARMEEPGSDVWVRVDARETWTMWLSGFSPAALARFGAEGTDAGAGSGLFVERVEWWLDGAQLESVAGDPDQPWRDERFAARSTPIRSGEFVLECRVFVRGADGPAELRSTPLVVRQELVLEPWMLAYARDAAENAFLGHEAALTVSSEESGFHPKGDVLDGLQGSAWWARADDPEPWLRLECAKGVRLKELWLSPAAASEIARASCAPVVRAELRLNDAKAPLWIEMDPDPRLKTKFVLPKATLVRKLELRLVAGPREPGTCVGLAELEGR